MNRYALGQKWLKKRTADLLVLLLRWSPRRGPECLTEQEAAAARRVAAARYLSSATAPNSPNKPDIHRPGELARPRIIFLGRISTKIKGLDLLVDACRLVKAKLLRRGVAIELYGPDHRGDARRLSQRIARIGLDDVAAR